LSTFPFHQKLWGFCRSSRRLNEMSLSLRVFFPSGPRNSFRPLLLFSFSSFPRPTVLFSPGTILGGRPRPPDFFPPFSHHSREVLCTGPCPPVCRYLGRKGTIFREFPVCRSFKDFSVMSGGGLKSLPSFSPTRRNRYSTPIRAEFVPYASYFLTPRVGRFSTLLPVPPPTGSVMSFLCHHYYDPPTRIGLSTFSFFLVTGALRRLGVALLPFLVVFCAPLFALRKGNSPLGFFPSRHQAIIPNPPTSLARDSRLHRPVDFPPIGLHLARCDVFLFFLLLFLRRPFVPRLEIVFSSRSLFGFFSLVVILSF